MSEGGLFTWKIQKIWQNGPVAVDSRGLKEPLPDPPEGMVWQQNRETHEWKLVPESEEAHEETRMVDGFPSERGEATRVGGAAAADDWEVLSDRVSLGSIGGAAIFVPRGESIRSITSLDNSSANLSTNNLSVPFRVQRTLSSSTIDSAEFTWNSSFAVLGVDYVEHVVLPSDTLQGLCLAYKISATRLRQANHFSGTSLLLAPKKLVIPLTKKAQRSGFIRVQDKESRVYKLHAFLAELPNVKEAEATAYLELSDWDLEEAIRSAMEDGEWEKEVKDESLPKSGDICIKVNLREGVPVGFRTLGAGIEPKQQQQQQPSSPTVTKGVAMTIYEGVPAIATKSVRPQDVYNAAPQHNEFGVEMQPLAKKSESKDC